MINRREFVGITVGAGATLALTPQLLHALQQPDGKALQPSGGKLMQRAIPSTGEMLPVISFGPRPTGAPIPYKPYEPQPTDVPAAKEVLETFLANGGRVVDVMHGGPIGEQSARTAAAELGIADKLFWTTHAANVPRVGGPYLPGVIAKADPAAVKAAMEEKLAKLKVKKIDLVMVASGADIPTYVAVLEEMKKEGRVRYIGVHELDPGSTAPLDRLESIMRNEPIDFVATDYSVGDRNVEQKILPLAIERKIAFMAYFPFDRRLIFERAKSTPLPEWAAEFDAKTWAQFFLKYVLSHPAVTVVRTGTTKAAHMLDNIGGGIGRLPNEAMRKRMAQLVDAFPALPEPPPPTPPPGMTVTTLEQVKEMQAKQTPSVALSAAVLDRYVGEYKHVAVGTKVTVRRDGEKLLFKVHSEYPDESPFVARSETRFASAPSTTLEFQLDGQGKVTGAVWGQGPTSIPLERK